MNEVAVNWNAVLAWVSAWTAEKSGTGGPTPTPTPDPDSHADSHAHAHPNSDPHPDPDAHPPPSTGTGCTATYTVTNQWQGGFGANVEVKNTGTTALTGWTVAWTFPTGQTITQLWNGAHTASGSAVTVANLSWNGALSSGGSTSFGFNGAWSGANTAPAAVTCIAR